MDLMNLWNVQGQLLLMLGVGVLLRRIGIFTASTKAFLTDFVLFVTLPCSIILSHRGAVCCGTVSWSPTRGSWGCRSQANCSVPGA